MRALAAIVVVVLFGCTYESSETYRASQTGQKLRVEYEVVQSSHEVTVTEDPDLEKIGMDRSRQRRLLVSVLTLPVLKKQSSLARLLLVLAWAI